MPATPEGTAGAKQRLGRPPKSPGARAWKNGMCRLRKGNVTPVDRFGPKALWGRDGKGRPSCPGFEARRPDLVAPNCPRTSVLRGASGPAAARPAAHRARCQDRQRQGTPAPTPVTDGSRPGLPGIRIKEEHNSSMPTAIIPGKKLALHRGAASIGVAPRPKVPCPVYRNR